MRFSRRRCLKAAVISATAIWLPATRLFGQLVAFPGAEGFGALATGGRGGSVYVVTNLNNSGPGSFEDAVSKSNRIVVFAVSGSVAMLDAFAAANGLLADVPEPASGAIIIVAGMGFLARRRKRGRCLQ
jgi:hypothetical protein